MLTQAASLSPTNARAIATACSSLPAVTNITRILCGVRAGISALRLARQALAQLGGRASILECLAIIHKQNRHLDSETRLEAGVTVNFDALDAGLEFRHLGGDHFFHFVAERAVVPCVENQLDHRGTLAIVAEDSKPHEDGLGDGTWR